MSRNLTPWLTAASLALLVMAAGACDDEPNAHCPPAFKVCAGACTDVKVDSKNCGACGTACKAGESCAAGKCVLGCGGGTTNCSGVCVNTATDVSNCGGCGTKCMAGQISEARRGANE